MNEDGRMARLDDLFRFSKRHKIKIASIADIISYRLKNEKLIKKFYSKSFEINNIKNVQLSIYKNKLDRYKSYAISKGKFKNNMSIAVRVLSKRVKNKSNLYNKEIKKNIKLLTKYKNFILVVINNELSNKKRNSDFTLRYYGIGAQILKDFNIKNMILLSRTKKKIIGLEGFDLKIKKQIIIK